MTTTNVGNSTSGEGSSSAHHITDSSFLDEPIESLVSRLRSRKRINAIKRLEEEARILKLLRKKISEQLQRLQVEEAVFQRELEGLLPRCHGNTELVALITEALSSYATVTNTTPQFSHQPLLSNTTVNPLSSPQSELPQRSDHDFVDSGQRLDNTAIISNASTDILQEMSGVRTEIEKDQSPESQQRNFMAFPSRSATVPQQSPAVTLSNDNTELLDIEEEDEEDDDKVTKQIEEILKLHYGQNYSKEIESSDDDEDEDDDA
jgi:hypothetical protein